MSINRGIYEEVVVHIYTECYSVTKNNEIMPFVAPQIDLEIVIT